MINPVSHFKNKLSWFTVVSELALRLSIHSARAHKLNKIDLRKYRGNPEKKERIRKLAFIQDQIASKFLISMHMVIMQPLPPKDEKRVTVISGDGKPIDMPRLRINSKGVRIN